MGERGVRFMGDYSEVTLSEYPREPAEVERVLDVVAAWLDEVGHPEITVEFRWPLRRSPPGTSRARRPVVCWKHEDGPDDALDSGSPQDVGPAWLLTYDSYGNETRVPVADGEWVTRAEVLALAAGKGYTLSLDG